MYQLISATPSPYARKVRIALAEKGLPFHLITEVPWHADTARLVGERHFAVGDSFSLADIAVGTALGYLSVRYPALPWRSLYPALASYADRLGERASFRDSMPFAQTISEKVV